MKNGFNAAYERVRVYEGGNSDDKRDPGGRTSRGVTQRVYDAWRTRKGLVLRDVYKATNAEIKTIYRDQYWNAVRGEELPAGVDLVLFDGAINSGPMQSIKWLQRALGVGADGVIGQITLEAVEANMDNDLLIAEIGARRMGFLRKLRTFKDFGRGWTARVSNVTAAGQAVASGSIGPAPVKVAAGGGHRKAEIEDVKQPAVGAGTGASISAGSLTLDGATEAINQATGQVQAVADLSEILHVIFVILTVAGVGLTLYAIWRNWRSSKAIDGSARAEVIDEAPA